ncbi:MAG: hypothetical protein JWO87_2722, partial [Phycisphaerales bacterium]|nr:hypothetical protein [Phycisphaerales bacterium]
GKNASTPRPDTYKNVCPTLEECPPEPTRTDKNVCPTKSSSYRALEL